MKKHKGKFSEESKNKKVDQSAIDAQTKNAKQGMRLNKYIANSGKCSRRDADLFIKSGNVQVNGKVVTEMGHRVNLEDEVIFDGQRIDPAPKEYVILNKPKGFFVTGNPNKHGRTVMDIVNKFTKSQLAPVGKLDNSATGLMLFTNDGTLSKKLASSKSQLKQLFDVNLNKPMQYDDLKMLQNEKTFIGGKQVVINSIDYVKSKPKRNIGIEIISTEDHIVPKIMKKMGYEVEKLDRVKYGEITKKDLPRGMCRHLTKQEVINLGLL
jgi:23S rRNA pseudouridine2605 synthase